MNLSNATSTVPTASLELKTRRAQFQTQTSTLDTRRRQAVCVRRACKRYGPKKNFNIVLDGLNMTVPKGTIYGLLGASGCGKTTLLSCIVGRRRLNSGEIWVLGGKPGSKESGVPGPRLGYMPQEISLYSEFSIKETFIYFGWVAGMTTEQINIKLEFLLKFLQLPSENRFIKNLSGGQQRRVSFAATLLGDPELLILDEPTVGVDPVLRQNIWDHLVQLTKDGKKTIIITTHYIEETRQATIIGLMRGGKFLAEESPSKLMEMHRLDTLEDVFLKLSRRQNMGLRRRSSILSSVTGVPPEPDADDEMSGEFGDNVSISSRRRSIVVTDEGNLPELPSEKKCYSNFNVLNLQHMKALIWKNFLWMWRNFGIMSFIIGLPVIQIVLFCLSIGKDPVGLTFAIVNKELNNSTDECIPSIGCNTTLLSCRFLNHLKNTSMIFVPYDTQQEAEYAVKRGWAWGTISFSANYSEALISRLENGKNAENWDLIYSDMDIVMDMSNQQIGQLLQRNILYSYIDFAREVTVACNYSEKLTSIPVNFKTPIYGPLNPNFTDFAAPGIILTIIFFLSVALTSGALLLERNEGLLERSLVCGVTGTEILFGLVLTQFVVMIGQTLMVMIFSFSVFQITCEGNIIWVSVLTVLTGLSGMCFGFVIAIVCANERSATYVAMGSFLPIVMLCGIIWPSEGMHPVLQKISYVLPLTKSTESMRFMLARGWDLSRSSVYYGFIATLTWITIFLSIAIFAIKFKKG
ncbi:ABC transporter G family member 20-like isoform X1 [Polistes fuscatus]|uniref:ABC transporter G family member 20-like isoform X1 n=2 Tax=Polistes fuscatus TaxID=30207 RepID=UPI001CA7C548|nr:ABC transporter G family member 20-like isoform X1 [Polistes fuscatus]XP_043497479.1 ABC transporter G family member 20-like isoform X1 [Polistes fuscatus]XP_043497480.1 ABC transporter G family member 20-like isoform X1 [Polistes fuscatus]XP_043497481.1 ABC transporter G family member 20-like isoform X1 [Polistes fuscatus]XP_043497482.1 ABC transporter G family member 20-like isoform X1 [Polistes fuscatus]XP_043497484.1 ABC transporter G family member 20-like isoform X1 [Polistes fuscatus]